MIEPQNFAERLRLRIGMIQGVHPDKINVAEAAREMGVSATSLWSTLRGAFPRSEEYWIALKNYCRVNLDWLICGIFKEDDNKKGQALFDHEREALTDSLDCPKCESKLRGTLLDYIHTPPGLPSGISCPRCGWRMPDIMAREMAFYKLIKLSPG